MRIVASLLLLVATVACVGREGASHPAPASRIAQLQTLLDALAVGWIVEGRTATEIQADQYGETVTLVRVGDGYQLWVDFCGPDETDHRREFDGIAKENALECSWFDGKNEPGCRSGYICRYGQSYHDLVGVSAVVLERVFGASGNAVVRYWYF